MDLTGKLSEKKHQYSSHNSEMKVNNSLGSKYEQVTTDNNDRGPSSSRPIKHMSNNA